MLVYQRVLPINGIDDDHPEKKKKLGKDGQGTQVLI